MFSAFFFCKKGIDKIEKRRYTKQAVAAGRRGRPDSRQLEKNFKKVLDKPGRVW